MRIPSKSNAPCSRCPIASTGFPVGNDGASTLAHLEQRVSYLLERLEASSDHRSGNLGRVEEGLQDILHHLERQQSNFASFVADNRSEPPAAQDSGLADLVKRELSDIRFQPGGNRPAHAGFARSRP